MSTAPVAVVIVSWNSERFLADCLDSLGRLARPVQEIVVVDNASTDGSLATASGRPGVRVLELEDNLGFCEANNRGIAETSAPFVLLLNPDTRVERDFVEGLLPAFEDAETGIACGKLLRFDGQTLDSAGQQLARSRKPLDRGYGKPDRGQYDRDEQVFGACGAAALYRRLMLDELSADCGGVFDARFFAFYEDLDLAWRARRRGWKAWYRHEAVAYHHRGGSAERGNLVRRVALLGRSAEVRFHVAKNRYLTILRNDSVAGYLGNLPFILARDLAMLGLIAVSSPGVLLRLWRERGVFGDTLALRRLDGGASRHHVS